MKATPHVFAGDLGHEGGSASGIHPPRMSGPRLWRPGHMGLPSQIWGQLCPVQWHILALPSDLKRPGHRHVVSSNPTRQASGWSPVLPAPPLGNSL